MPKRFALIGLVLLALIAAGLSWQALTRDQGLSGAPATPAPAGTTPATTGTSSSPATSPSAAGTLVILGDGYSASSPWPTYAGASLGLTVVNMSASGTGYHLAPKSCTVTPCTSFKDSATKVAAAKPAVVVVVGGEVDGDYDLRADAAATLTALQKAVPQATIVFMSPISARPTHPAWLTVSAQTIKQAAANGNATWLDTSAVTATANAYRNGDLTEESSHQLAALLVEGLK